MSLAADPALARDLYAAAHLTGRFVLRSGKISGEYFDKFRFESDPALLRRIARRMLALVPTDTDVLAGLELGGVPIASASSRPAVAGPHSRSESEGQSIECRSSRISAVSISGRISRARSSSSDWRTPKSCASSQTRFISSST